MRFWIILVGLLNAELITKLNAPRLLFFMNKVSRRLMTEFVGGGGLRTFARGRPQPLIIFCAELKT